MERSSCDKAFCPDDPKQEQEQQECQIWLTELLLNNMANRGKGERCLNSFVHMFLVSAISVLFAGKSAEQTEE